MPITNELPVNTLNDVKQQYDRDGYVIFSNVIDSGLIQEARSHIGWLMKKNPELRPENLHTELVNGDPFWVRLVSDERLLDIAELFVGPNIALFASHYICKPPNTGQPVLWHQDGSYWPLEPMEVTSLWLAITDSTSDNGCMRVIPGTQYMDLSQLRERDDVENVLASSMDESLVEESKAVDINLRAGDVSIHHPNVIHGSKTNNSSTWRNGLTIRYIPTTTRINNGLVPLHLRGDRIEGINTYGEIPKYCEGKHMKFRNCEEWT